MTKKDIADHLCNRLDLRKSEAINAVDEVFSFIADSFAKAQNVYLRGFGTFNVAFLKEKKARNITKGTQILVPAHKTVKFRISKALKKRINSK